MQAHTMSTRSSRGFTLMEILMAIAVISILIAILIVGIRHTSQLAGRRIDENSVNALKTAVDQFKIEFGFHVPLVKDIMPLKLGASGMVPNTYLESVPSDVQFLRNRNGNMPTPPSTQATPDDRFSVYSLAYYVMGALPSGIDGVEGNGSREAARDGSFKLAGGKTYQPFFDASRVKGLNPIDPAAGRIELRDRHGKAFRYYYWLEGVDPTGEVLTPVDRNVPSVIGNASADSELRNVRYAIVGAGANGVFGDLGSESANEVEEATRQPAGTAINVLESKARQDNVVAVGG